MADEVASCCREVEDHVDTLAATNAAAAQRPDLLAPAEPCIRFRMRWFTAWPDWRVIRSAMAERRPTVAATEFG